MLSEGSTRAALVALMTAPVGRVRTYAAARTKAGAGPQDRELGSAPSTTTAASRTGPAEELPALIAEAGEPFADPALLAMAGLLRKWRGRCSPGTR